MTTNEFLSNYTKNISPKKVCGIYAIYSAITNRIYIGQSKSIYRRWTEHKIELKNSQHCNSHLQAIYDKYGKDALSFFILEQCTKEELDAKEAFLISLITKEDLINQAPIGEFKGSENYKNKKKNRPKRASTKLSQETKDKISQAHKELGTIPPSRKGCKLTEEQSKAMSERLMGNKHCVGYKHTEETKKKMSEAQRGNKSNTGRKLTEEHKNNIKLAHARRKALKEQA